MLIGLYPTPVLALQGDRHWPGHWWTGQVWSLGDPAGVSCSKGPNTCHVWSTNGPPAVWGKDQDWRHCGSAGEEENGSTSFLTSIWPHVSAHSSVVVHSAWLTIALAFGFMFTTLMARCSEQICFNDNMHKHTNQRLSCVTLVSKLLFSFFFYYLQWGLHGSGGGESWEQVY